MKKYLIFLFVFLLPVAALIAAENQGKAKLPDSFLFYYQFHPFAGLVVASDGNPGGYSMYGPEMRRIIKNVPDAYAKYVESDSKMLTGTVVRVCGGLIGGGIIVGGLMTMTTTSGYSSSTSFNAPLMLGGAVVFFTGLIAGRLMELDAYNMFYSAINDCNQAILKIEMTGDGKAMIKKNIKF